MDIEHYARALQRPGALRSSFSYYRALPIDRSDNSVWGQTPLPMPVLAIGAEWGYGPASEHTMRRVAKDVQGAIIERCGHYPAEERPSELARAIIDFSAATIDNTLSISTLPDARITAGHSIVPRRATVTGSGPAKK